MFCIFGVGAVFQGVTLTNGLQCPMCRGSIAPDYLQQPTLLTPPPAVKSFRRARGGNTERTTPKTLEKQIEYQWFYEGKNGKLFSYGSLFNSYATRELYYHSSLLLKDVVRLLRIIDDFIIFL